MNTNVKSILEEQQQLVVDCKNEVVIISMTHVRMLASGAASIAEFEDPEAVAKALAIALIEKMNG